MKTLIVFLACLTLSAFASEKPQIEPGQFPPPEDRQIVSPISSRKPLMVLESNGTWTAYYDDKARTLDASKPVIIVNPPTSIQESKQPEKQVVREIKIVREKVVAEKEREVKVLVEQKTDFPVRYSERAKQALENAKRAEDATHAAQRFMEDSIKRKRAEEERRRVLRESDRSVSLQRTTRHSPGKKEVSRSSPGGDEDSLSSDEEEVSDDEEP